MLERADYLVTIEPDGAAYIGAGEHETVELRGDVVIGVMSAHSKREAMSFAVPFVPQKARQEEGWFEHPETFGIRAYKLDPTDREGG